MSNISKCLATLGQLKGVVDNVKNTYPTKAEVKALVGTPLVAATAADMTDHNKIYVYTGSQTGYNNGHWYYWNGSAWSDGGVYNAVAVDTDKTLSIENKAADAKKTGDELSSLKSDLKISGNMQLLPDSYYTISGQILNGAGDGIRDSTGYSTTEYIPIYFPNARFIGNGFPGTTYSSFCLYDESHNVLVNARGAFDIKISEYPTAKYFRASTDIAVKTYYVNVGLDFDDTALRLFSNALLADRYYTISGQILNGNGTGTRSSAGYYTTEYLPIPFPNARFIGKAFPVAAFNTFCLYDSSKNVLLEAKGDFDVKISDYPTAAYFRASSDLAVKSFYVNVGLDSILYDKPDIDNPVTIEVGTGKPYTTLRSGIAEASNYKNAHVIVYPGVYDLTQEFATEISAATGVVGITLSNNMYVEFLSGAYVKAIFTQSSEWISTYFNPFRGRDFTLDGLNLEVANCRYCVHDEQSGADVTYHNVYKNCIMKNTTNRSSGVTGNLYSQCIGGGLGKHGYIEIIGGKYTSSGVPDGANEIPCISYHNGDIDGADSKLFIRDVYLDGDAGNLRFGYLGPSTIKSQVLISGCSMGSAIIHRAESAGYVIDNFEITEWDNIIRSA